MHRPSRRSSRSPIRPQQVCSTRKAVTRARGRGGGALRPRSLKTGKRRLVQLGGTRAPPGSPPPEASPSASTESVSPPLLALSLVNMYLSSFLKSRFGGCGGGRRQAFMLVQKGLFVHTNLLISLWGRGRDYLPFQATFGIFYPKTAGF